MRSVIKPVIAITMGDPNGIGSEVIAKALAASQIHRWCQPIVVGNTWSLKQAIKLTNLQLQVREISDVHNIESSPKIANIIDIHNLNPVDITVGQVSPICGKASMEWVSKATDLALAGHVQALVTAPINKAAASLAGYKAIGHMELLQQMSGASEIATMLISGKLRVVHLTTHRSLRKACELVTKTEVLSKLKLTHEYFSKWGLPNPRIGTAALNPHGSDGGLLGDEEATAIAPAVEQAQIQGIDAHGPIPADIVFYQAIQGKYDVVLAMYHDQGHIPVKVYGFEDSISVNLGLPFVRTSVDHGTAFDIAGKGVADHRSLVEAVRIASALCTGKGLSEN